MSLAHREPPHLQGPETTGAVTQASVQNQAQPLPLLASEQTEVGFESVQRDGASRGSHPVHCVFIAH